MSPSKPNSTIIGRQAEKQALTRAAKSAESELIAVYGRRRVGKTFLVRQFLGEHITFEMTGLHGEPMHRQLENFSSALRRYSREELLVTPTSWLEAFEVLGKHVDRESNRRKSKQVLFFDEIPWLATRRSGFLAAFEHFWNTFASRRNDLMLVICGSAASWMIEKVIGSKGGLHNRTTGRIRLEPFGLSETREYLEHRNVKLDDFQIAQIYMALGGIPQYLNHVRPGKSAAQNIDQLCFAKEGLLIDEFDHLYAALFENHQLHESLVRGLGSSAGGLTRNELLKKASVESGGGISRALRELIQSGFVHESPPRDNQIKETVYRLADEYSLFYLKWIEPNRVSGKDVWLKKSASRSFSTWLGYAFETLCLKHVRQVKKALGIEAVETNESSWVYRPKPPDEEGAQIDLLIDRRDRCTNLCEMKFSESPFVINKKYAMELDRKLRVFKVRSGTNNTVFLTFVTSAGVQSNVHSQRLVSSEVELKDLYESL